VTNLLTQSQSGVVGGYPANGNVTFSTSLDINGITTGVVFGNNSLVRFAYKINHTFVASQHYLFSCFVKMDDGLAPVFTSSTTSGDFNLILDGTDAIATGQQFSDNGVWRCWARYLEPAIPNGVQNTGVLKRLAHSARTFTCTGYQLEKEFSGGDYVVTTTTPITQESI
jgi:hypothetical protein